MSSWFIIFVIQTQFINTFMTASISLRHWGQGNLSFFSFSAQPSQYPACMVRPWTRPQFPLKFSKQIWQTKVPSGSGFSGDGNCGGAETDADKGFGTGVVRFVGAKNRRLLLSNWMCLATRKMSQNLFVLQSIHLHFYQRKCYISLHSVARANLNKSEDLMTNTIPEQNSKSY